MLFIKQTLAFLLVIALGYWIYTLAINQEKFKNKLSPNADGTIVFSGTVISNTSECETGNCSLILQNEKKTAYVIYDSGDIYCLNTVAASKAKSIALNTKVQVYGYYEYKNNENIIRTCPTASYYIQNI